jgi:uncharacterized protein YutE (UPF0331/DUF86 family)
LSELLLRKALVCRDRIERIRARLPDDAQAVLQDELLEAFISFQLLLLIQDVVDLAVHLVAARGLDVPGSQREAFEALAKAGLISHDTAAAMGAAAALRNRIAHTYGDVDPVRVVREAPGGLDRVSRFLDEITKVIAE